MPFETRGNESKRYGYVPLRVGNRTRRLYIGREADPVARLVIRTHRLTAARRAARRSALDKALNDQRQMEQVLDLLVGCARLWRRGALLGVPQLLKRPERPTTELTDDRLSTYRSAIEMNAPLRDIFKLLRDAEKNAPGAKQKLERLQRRYAEAFSVGCDLVTIARDLRVKSLAADSTIAQASIQSQFDAVIDRIRSSSTDDPVDYLLTEITAVYFLDVMHCQIFKGRVGDEIRHAEDWEKLFVRSQARFDCALEALLRYRASVKQQS